ncbi:MAG TPA: PIN domain-containing protein [Kribbellaceae bacterium]
MDAFDTNALIYAVLPGNDLGARVLALFTAADATSGDPRVGIGSVLVLPELLCKPLRSGASNEVDALLRLVSRLDLRPVDRATAMLAAQLAAKYALKAIDATHLATAVVVGADRFITNNRRDFPTTIKEVDVVYPDRLPDPD